MDKKYKFNRQSDEYLAETYKHHKAKSVKQKIKVIEKLEKLKDGEYVITRFTPGSNKFLMALEFIFLTHRNLLV